MRPLLAICLLCALIAGLSLIITGSARAQDVPARSGYVVNEANLISAITEITINDQLSTYEQQTGKQVLIVTLPDMQGYSDDDFVQAMVREWHLGEANGEKWLILVYAVAEDWIAIHTGDGLESAGQQETGEAFFNYLTDIARKTGDWSAVFRDASSMIIAVLEGTEKAKILDRPEYQHPPEDDAPDEPTETSLWTIAIISLVFTLLVYFMIFGVGGRQLPRVMGSPDLDFHEVKQYHRMNPTRRYGTKETGGGIPNRMPKDPARSTNTGEPDR